MELLIAVNKVSVHFVEYVLFFSLQVVQLTCIQNSDYELQNIATTISCITRVHCIVMKVTCLKATMFLKSKHRY